MPAKRNVYDRQNLHIIKLLDINIVFDWSYNASDNSDNNVMQYYVNLHSEHNHL